MNTITLNTLFLAGSACIVAAAFLIALPLGLFVLGFPLVCVSIYMQLQRMKKVKR